MCSKCTMLSKLGKWLLVHFFLLNYNLMTINVRIILLLVLILNLSCKQEKRADTSCLVIDSEFTGEDCIKLSDFVESIELIPLETNQEYLVETVGKIIKHKDYYYIGSTSNVINKILVFDKNGDFIYKLDKKGIGPNEYIDIRDFDVIDKNNIVIVSRSNPGIYVYNIDKDTCILHQSIDIYPNSILAKDNYFYVMNNGTPFNRKTNDLIFKYDKQANLVNSFFNVNSSTISIISNIAPLVSLSSYKNDLYFNHPFCNTIYNIKDTEITSKYRLDFGNRDLPREFLNNADNILDIEKLIKKSKGIYSLIYYAINSPFSLFTFYDYQLQGYILLYNSDMNKSLIANEIIDDIYFKGNRIALKAWKLPKSLDYNTIYYHIEPSDLIDYSQKLKKSLNDNEWKLFCSSHPKIMTVVNNINEEDNPIILKIKLKKQS